MGNNNELKTIEHARRVKPLLKSGTATGDQSMDDNLASGVRKRILSLNLHWKPDRNQLKTI